MDEDRQPEPNPDDENDARQEAIRDDEQEQEEELNNPYNHKWKDTADGEPKVWICGNCTEENPDGTRECESCMARGFNFTLVYNPDLEELRKAAVRPAPAADLEAELEKLRPDLVERCGDVDTNISLYAEGEMSMLGKVLILLHKDA